MGVSIDFPIFYSLACTLLGLAYAFFLYRNERLITNKKLLTTLFVLRFILVSILASLLLNPTLKSIQKKVEEPIVIIAQDVSSSIQDSTFQLLTNLSKQFPDFQLYTYSFSDDINSGFSTKNNGLKTNFSHLFDEIESRFANRNVAALILASDGLYNTGSNPLYRKGNNYPIYPIVLGDTTIKTEVSIVKVKQNEIAFLGNSFPLEISLDMQQAKGKHTQLTIWNNGNKLHSEKINITTNDEFKKVKIKIEATAIGLQKYRIVASTVDSEINTNNNRYTAYVEVIDSKYKILLLNGLNHPDIAAYKSAIEKNKNYSIEQYHINDFKGSIDAYQLIVLFGADNNVEVIKMIQNSKIPLLIFQLNKLGINEKLTTAIRFVNKGSTEEVRAIKNQQFSKFTFSNKLLHLLSEAPPLNTPFGNYELSNIAELILQQKIGMYISDKPIIFLSEQEGKKMALVTAEGFWKWKLYDYAHNSNNEAFNELFSKLTQYLVLQEDKSRFRLAYKKQFSEVENIYFDASLFNESFELISDKDIEISIIDEKGTAYNFEFSTYNNQYNLDVGKLAIGSYSFLAKVRGSELKKRGSFDVKVIQLEQLKTVADHQFLTSLAMGSGGKVFSAENVNELISEIENNKHNYKIIHTKEKLEGIINIPWILVSLLFLISTEWFVRKYNGLL